MKKMLIVLLLALLILCCAGVTCAEGEPRKGETKVSMTFFGTGNNPPAVQAGDKLLLTIRIENTSGEEFDSPMYLFDPAHEAVPDFPNVRLKAGESVEWSGNWTVTEEQIRTKKLTYRIQYRYLDENGESKRIAKNFTKKLTLKGEASSEPAPEATPEPTPEPTPRPEDRPQVFLYSVTRPNPGNGTISVACIDKAGDLWFAEKADVEYPFREKEILQLLRERRGMVLKTNLIAGILRDVSRDKEWFRGLAVMAEIVPKADGTPVKTGVDVDQEAVYALRTDTDGNPESVLLGVSGSYVFENKDPNAQALYLFMWHTRSAYPYGFAAEGLAPHGFETVSVREFFGLQHVDAETAVITAALTDCEEGPIEAQLTEKDREKVLALLDRGIVIGKENPWVVTGGTMCYYFHNAQGEYLGCIETYSEDSLAVSNDGMYRLSLLPRSTENLTEEEQKLLHLKINGIDYEIGRSTPRDLIRNGWPCAIEYDGTFSFQDPEMYSTIYVNTENDGLDEPIKSISCQFAPTVPIEYGGFDGEVDPEDPNDKDTAWFIEGYEGYRNNHPDEELEDIRYVLEHWNEEEDDEDDGWGGYWDPMQLWIETLGEVDEDSDNGTDVDVFLSDGHTLRIFTAASPVCLSLGDEQYIRLGPEADDW